jgi:hypothetical protein
VTSHAGPAYKARYGRTPKHIIGMCYCFAMTAMILLIPAPAWVRVIVAGTLGSVGVMLATLTFSRSPALGVDAAGVTIRPYPLRFSVIAFYPWENVAQILIVRSRQTNGQYVQIRPRPGTALSSLSPLTRPKNREALAMAGDCVAVNGWTLHPAVLAAAVARFAPAVQVVDATTGSVVSPEHVVADDTGQLPQRHVPAAHGWPEWVLAGAGAGLVAGVILAVVNGPAHSAASTAAGFLILLALAAACVAAPATFYRRYRARRGAVPSSPDIGGAADQVLPEDWS